MRNLKKIIKRFFFRIRDIRYLVGDYNILIPSTHTLPINQIKYKNYDKKIGSIVAIVEKFSGAASLIDIGANVGDTAAMMRTFSSSTIYCIEGDTFFLKYLRRNIEIIPDVKIFDSFVGVENMKIDYVVERNGGTARLKVSKGAQSKCKFIGLSEIVLEVHNQIGLVKIDTDGFDFDIILGNKIFFETNLPAIYFEYDIGFNENSFKDSLDTILFLENLNYNFIVYDNYGNLVDFLFDKCYDNFLKLNQYLRSSLKFGGGIYYFDVFASTNKDMIKSIVADDNSRHI